MHNDYMNSANALDHGQMAKIHLDLHAWLLKSKIMFDDNNTANKE